MIGNRLATLPKPKQDINKKSRPPEEQRGHEPVTKLKDMIDLIAVGGSVVGRHSQKLVDQCKAIHTCSSPPRSGPDEARPATGHGATDKGSTRRTRRLPTSQHQKETKSPRPCARSICRPWRRSKTGTPTLAVWQTQRIPTTTRRLFSCDDPQPFHFLVEPDAIHHQHNRDHERGDRAGNVNRGAFHEVDPETPHSGPQRKKRREDDEHNMESFKRHLAKDRVVVPRQKYEPEHAKH